MKHTLFISTLACCLALVACSDDPAAPVKDTPPPPSSLTQRWHVVSQLQTVNNQRDSQEYTKLLDDNFVFIFSDEDFSQGNTPQQWDRAADIVAMTNMLDPNYAGNYRINSIDVDLEFIAGAVDWTEITPPLSAQGETWYTTTVVYAFTMQAEPDITWLTQGKPRARLTIRSVQVDGATQWRLVEWKDLANQTKRTPPVATGSNVGLTEEATWGKIKTLYR